MNTGYDIPADFLRALSDVQGGMCGICGHRDTGRALCLDHDHDSGLIRGFLCTDCNFQEGRNRCQCVEWESCVWCTWRRRPAVAVLGITYSFDDPRNKTFAYAKHAVTRHVEERERSRKIAATVFADLWPTAWPKPKEVVA